ncbi:LysR family transcriptional regulator [Falsigemmobacter faecalis]|uniref:LysR family transcriptional regulator n=1 Tax=Falsigemmobacter faecalis TaxID=2488730 RepID=A0A3P3D720_9RHOB|nr:LysR family transcriptional regulator [Falsigemmobacter faecalis]RRH70147.1 LysR family transcriptional regulator [Falsigemmobacter faecalis]
METAIRDSADRLAKKEQGCLVYLHQLQESSRMAKFSTSSYDIRQLRTFTTVVEFGGMSAAAIKLGTSLSSVSRDITALETRLGIALCSRGRSGFSLTPHGADVHGAALQLLEAMKIFEQTVDHSRSSAGGTLTLGSIDSVITNPEAGIVRALSQIHRILPDIQVNVSMHPVSVIDVKVRNSELDMGITAQPEGLPALVYENAFKENQRLYIARYSPHVQLAKAVGEALSAGREPPAGSRIPYIARSYRADAFSELERVMPFQVVARGSSLESILASVLAGLGCAVLPAHILSKAGGEQLMEIPTPFTPMDVQFHFAYRRDSLKLRAIRTMVACFHEAALKR